VTNSAVKLSVTAAGLYLLVGMVIGVVKYLTTMRSPEHRAPVYIDIAHRAAFFYSFAALVMAKLVEHNSFSVPILLAATILVLLFFTLTVAGYLTEGLKNQTDNIFRERNLVTTWFMYCLIVGEIGGYVVILTGFLLQAFEVR
jgi:hypothetical protein